jgi:PPOX class probable F420-dependent enzyme
VTDERSTWLRNRAEIRLQEAETYWVATVTPDHRPHSTPVWGVWHDGCFWFTTFARARKGRNLLANPNVVIHLDSGEDVVIIDGVAEAVEDRHALTPVSDRYAEKYLDVRTGRPYRPDADLAQGSGGVLFRVRPTAGRTWLNGALDEMHHRWTYST